MSLKKFITIKWDIYDVLAVCPYLTQQQACQVLAHICKNHDAAIGVDWDVIESAVSDLLFSE